MSDKIVRIIKEEIDKLDISIKESDSRGRSIISEGLSKIVYHFTYTDNLINILKLNKFATSSNLGSAADKWKDKGKYFFFSTQRTKGMSGYGSRHGNVAIVLNGEKLNQNFKGFPTDYWNWSKKRSDYNYHGDYIRALTSTENEDRIVTDKPYIDNASDYILEIHVEAKSDRQDYLNRDGLNEIINLCKEHNMHVYFYDNERDFKLQNKAKAIAPENIDVKEKEENGYDNYSSEGDAYWFFKKFAPIISFNNNEGSNAIQKLIYKYLHDAYDKESYDQQYNNLMSDIDDKIKKMNSRWVHADDDYYSLSADIHNARGNPNPYFRELLKLLIADMKKWQASTLKEYIEKKLKTKIR